MAEQRREYFRVKYPLFDRPVISARSGRFEVIDLSEFGVCFKRDDQHAFEPGMLLLARIRFRDGSECECSGVVLRCHPDSVSVQLQTPIPMRRIHSETVYLSLTYNIRSA